MVCRVGSSYSCGEGTLIAPWGGGGRCDGHRLGSTVQTTCKYRLCTIVTLVHHYHNIIVGIFIRIKTLLILPVASVRENAFFYGTVLLTSWHKYIR